jgi:stress response protein SCP2
MNKLNICIRNSFLILPEWNESPVVSYSFLGTFLKKLENCGYTVSNELLTALILMPQNSFLSFAKDVLEIVEEASGMSYSWKPFYPNFPQEVMDICDCELYINAIIHYWTLARPSQDDKIEPLPLVGRIQDLKVLELGSDKQFEELFKLMMKSKSSLTSLQKEELGWFLTNYGSVLVVLTLPEKFEHQEVMAFVVSQLIKIKVLTIDNSFSSRYYNSATSVLRVIVGLNDGDLSLAKKVSFVKMNNKLVKSICVALEAIGNLDVDMLRHVNKWKLLFKLMRAKQFSTKKYPKLCKAVNIVRGHESVKTFNALTESYFAQQNLGPLMNHLKTRPSMFARTLDRVINTFEDTDHILYSFKRIADECSSLVLFQLIGFYRSRSINPKRIFMPKGDKAQGYAIDNKLPELAPTTIERIIDICFNALVDNYSVLLELGDVFIDPILKDYTLPLQLRSASPSLKTVGRGTRFDFDKTFIRLFMNWVNLKGDEEDGETRTDLDLSAYLLNENFEEVTTIAYYQLKDDSVKCFHSGDIVNAPAPDGACEFIDIDVKSAVDNGVRYVAMCVHNFTNQSFVNFETAFAGWMTRDNIQSGEAFEPRTVNHRYDLTADSNFSLPVVFDLVEGKAIWLDLSISTNPSFPTNVHSNRMTTSLIIQAIVNRQFPTMYDLLQAHTKARGVQVYTKDEADTVFDLSADSMLRPWELEKILGEYL